MKPFQTTNLFLSKIQLVIIATLLASTANPAQFPEESVIKFAFFSSAWAANSDDGMKLILANNTKNELKLNSITFLKKDQQDSERIKVEINTKIPPFGYAGKEFEYVDLLRENECIDRTLAENWKLVEVSNYTLNPSVRNLIIEDIESFRIYQCAEYVKINWTNLASNKEIELTEWVLFHFETRYGDS